MDKKLSNPEVYLVPRQTPKIVFCENSQRLKAINFFVKHPTLDV